MEQDEINIRKRHLPHWTIKDGTYFITFRSIQGELSIKEQVLVLDHIKEGDGIFYELVAAIVMPDHVHIILSPLDDIPLRRVMKGIKGVSARKINLLRKRNGSIWQDESYDRIIRDQAELNVKLRYMFNNPIKKGLTDDPWSYHGWYCKTFIDEISPPSEGRSDILV